MTHSRILRAGLVIGLSAVAATAAAQTPADFVAVLPHEVRWTPHPTVRGAEIAILMGDPSGEGPYAMRLRFQPNTRVEPHTHPESRSYTVLEGEWKLGFGTRFNEADLRSFPAGSLYRLPANAPHFQMTGATVTVIQVQARGPTTTTPVR